MTILQFLIDASFIVWIILSLSIISVAIVMERMVFFFRFRYNKILSENIKQILISHQKDKLPKAIHLCNNNRVFTLFYKNLLSNAHKTTDEIEKIVNNDCQRYIILLERRLTTISTISSISPLLGILGTVVGMIKSFVVLGWENSENGLLAKGISEALLTTAMGLVVAIPCIVFYNYFSKRIDIISRRFELDLSDFLSLINSSSPKKNDRKI